LTVKGIAKCVEWTSTSVKLGPFVMSPMRRPVVSVGSSLKTSTFGRRAPGRPRCSSVRHSRPSRSSAWISSSITKRSYWWMITSATRAGFSQRSSYQTPALWPGIPDHRVLSFPSAAFSGVRFSKDSDAAPSPGGPSSGLPDLAEEPRAARGASDKQEDRGSASWLAYQVCRVGNTALVPQERIRKLAPQARGWAVFLGGLRPVVAAYSRHTRGGVWRALLRQRRSSILKRAVVTEHDPPGNRLAGGALSWRAPVPRRRFFSLPGAVAHPQAGTPRNPPRNQSRVNSLDSLLAALYLQVVMARSAPGMGYGES